MRCYLAEVQLSIPAHDPRRMEALGMKECSRAPLARAIPAGTLARVVPLTGTALWMAYFRGGAVVKLSSEAARNHLVALRDEGGRVVPDGSGVGDELRRAQNARAGGGVRRPAGAAS